MPGRHLVLIGFVIAASACGGDLEVYNNQDPDAAEGSDVDAGTATPEDTGQPVQPADPDTGNAVVDMGGPPDTGPVEDMTPVPDMDEPEPLPTTDAPQSGPTVNQQITDSCATSSVKGLSLQLMEQLNCIDPGRMKSFEGQAGISYGSSVFPFMQTPATDALVAAAQSKADTMPVNSATRTIAQQLLLYEWYRRGLCNANLAATPGRSNHNGGLAVDVGNNSVWRTPLRNRNFVDNVASEPWHFYFQGAGGEDIRDKSVLAFQQLYNLNFPENPIDEDGLYGPMTEGALKNSPANGFSREPRCAATMSMSAFSSWVLLDVDWERVDDRLLRVRTVAPSGVRLVEYSVDDVVVGYSDAVGPGQFDTLVELPVSGPSTLEIRAYDSWGEERGIARGLVSPGDEGTSLSLRPTGGTNYELRLDDLRRRVRSVDIFVDGIPIAPSQQQALAKTGRKVVHLQLDGKHTIDVVLYDRHGRIVEILERTIVTP